MRIQKKYLISIGVILLLFVGYFIADHLLFDGVRPKFVKENGFQANYFVKDNLNNRTAVILIGGGQWGDYWAQEFYKKDMVGLSILYTGKEGLPKLPEEIELEYFENAINWLKQQPEVNPDKIVVMGASRNAELALVIASTFPETIRGVIAYAPSSVSWSNTVLPYNSDTLKASWTYRGKDIPYIPMTKITGNNTDKIKVIDYWTNGLSNTEAVQKASINVEDINGPIILFSGNEDQVWPSSVMADMIEERLKTNNFKHSFQNIKYNNAGHLISTNPNVSSSLRTGIMSIDGKDYEYDYGGSDEGDFKAKQDAKIKLMEFLEDL